MHQDNSIIILRTEVETDKLQLQTRPALNVLCVPRNLSAHWPVDSIILYSGTGVGHRPR